MIEVNKKTCTGCEMCTNICPKDCISMEEDEFGFRYPIIDVAKCINCNLCEKYCPAIEYKEYSFEPTIMAMQNKNEEERLQSSSGGVFSVLAKTIINNRGYVYGARWNGLSVEHIEISSIDDLNQLRGSKYLQSHIGNSYRLIRNRLNNGQMVLFSGTGCQIAGLKSFLRNKEYENLLTIEVVCEGVPSPLFVRKLSDYLSERQGSDLIELDYRYKDGHKWDFQVMQAKFADGSSLKKDRWFNPYWKLWLSHLMSRPSCYECKYAKNERCADITLGDLWGVHLYCPELYARNAGASLMIGNTEKGILAIKKAEKYMNGHDLEFAQALKYQSPMRKHIDGNPNRELFMADLESNMSYEELIKKWYRKPSLKLLWQKYVWGNRQKVALWNLKNRLR